MQLLFIHGPAAVGKYTVAKILADRTGGEFYHNHQVVDAVLARHGFGSPGFIAERDRLWREYFTCCPGPGKEQVIFTFNPENSVPQAFIDWLFAEMPRRGIRLISIGLTASEAVLECRIAAASRQQFRKLTDVALYRELRARGVFDQPLIPHTDLRIDTSLKEPAETARQIAEFSHVD